MKILIIITIIMALSVILYLPAVTAVTAIVGFILAIEQGSRDLEEIRRSDKSQRLDK